jgi:uncharacterized membrane protein (UPF0127 family)
VNRSRWLFVLAALVLAVSSAAYLAQGPDRPSGSATASLPAPGAKPDRVLLSGFSEVAVIVTAPDGKVLGYCLLRAATAAQRERGLMTVTDLHGYEGMVFSYETDTDSAFYMRNTPMPLSIVWLTVDGSIVSTADMAPCADVEGCRTYPPGGRYRNAIEVPQGRLAPLGIVTGSKVAVGGTCT